MKNPGIDPGTSRMLSGRSTVWANSSVSLEFVDISWSFWTKDFIVLYQGATFDPVVDLVSRMRIV